MAYSTRLRELVKRLRILERHFLPKKLSFPPTGQYTAQEEDYARAYVLFVHAELESYIEDRANEVVSKAHLTWKTTGTCSKVLARLIRHHLDTQKRFWLPVVPSEKTVAAAVNFYSSILKGNHGIKEANVTSILCPLGLVYARLDSTWLATLDSFGSLRGSFAHAAIKAHQSIDPQNEYRTVSNQIMPALKKLDGRLSRLR